MCSADSSARETEGSGHSEAISWLPLLLFFTPSLHPFRPLLLLPRSPTTILSVLALRLSRTAVPVERELATHCRNRRLSVDTASIKDEKTGPL